MVFVENTRVEINPDFFTQTKDCVMFMMILYSVVPLFGTEAYESGVQVLVKSGSPGEGS